MVDMPDAQIIRMFPRLVVGSPSCHDPGTAERDGGDDHDGGGVRHGVAQRETVPATVAPSGDAAGSEDEEDLIEEFLACCSRPTAACYRRDLRHVRGHLARQEVLLLTAKRADYGRYIRALEMEGVPPTTIRRRLAAAGSLYRHLVADGLLAVSPVDGLRRPAGESAPRLGLDIAALRNLWAAACRRSGAVQLLVALLLLAGLRVSEAVAIDSGDVRHDAGRTYAEVVRKGGKVGLVALVGPLAGLVTETADIQGPGPLLRSDRGGRLDRRRAWEIVRALGDEVGIVGLGPHLLRHTHVTTALRAGVGLVTVQASAAHSDPRITARYAQALLAVAGEAGAAVAHLADDSDSSEATPGS